MAKDPVAFGKHHVLARLGRGGMGDVYLAVNFGPGGVQKLVVIKKLRGEFADTADARSMFLDEARIAARLNHPNVVQTNEVVEEGDELYLLMDFLDGQSLARILGNKHRADFSRPKQLRILADALAGLHYAHELTDYDGTKLNVVHRDVSPQNIIVTYDGHVKLVDFGVAKADVTTTVTSAGTFKGKVRYSAPEQALCNEVDRRVDIFAVGVILWEILTQRRMWPEQSDAAILMALASGRIPLASEIPADVPETLRTICAKALEWNPDARYATAHEFRCALLAYLRSINEDTELSATMTASFAQERHDLRAIIDAQVKAVREASVRALHVRSVPIISVDSVGIERSSGARRSSIPISASVHTVPPQRAPRPGLWIASGIVGVGAVIASGLFLRPMHGEASAGNGASAGISAGAEQVHLHVRATPANAQILLDGKPLAGNPHEGDVARDATTHTLIVKADGFEPRTIQAVFTRAVDVEVALSPASAAASPAPKKHAGARSQIDKGSALTAPPKVQRAIDEEDPYKQ
jgi:serine/threonine-protein kinase